MARDANAMSEDGQAETPADTPAVAPLTPEAFRKALRIWYRKHARTLPWRGIDDPYATWLSEIMLQQTRVATVIERYTEFLARFPTIAALAEAPEDDVLALWSGLGYYRRARMLHRGAQFVARELNGALPSNSAALRTLPGIGEYTAAAVASIAFGESIAVLDGNVERVLLRLLGQPEQRTASARTGLIRTANALVPPAASRRSAGNPPGDHNQAMMELGATICLPRNPLCLQCPVFQFCQTRGQHPTPARGKLRSRHVACLLATRKSGTRTQVLLERRPAEATLMAGMLELPPLPLDAVQGREPVLRLRHGITNTSYYVEVHAEGSVNSMNPQLVLPKQRPGAQDEIPFPAQPPAQLPPQLDEDLAAEADLAVEAAVSPVAAGSGGLRGSIPASTEDLLWCTTGRLLEQPLTGLTRKVLQRLGLMPMLRVRVGTGQGSV